MPGKAPSDPVVQRFHRTSGSFMGYAGLVMVVAVIVLVAFDSPNVTGLRVVFGLAVGGVLVWAVLLRPRAEASRETLVLHNMFSDTYLPLAGVEHVVVRHTLNVWVADHRYVCAGIGRTSRQMMKQSTGRTSMLSGLGLRPSTGEDRVPTDEENYAQFVEKSISDLADNARAEGRDRQAAARRTPAVPELVALGLAVVAFVVALLA